MANYTRERSSYGGIVGTIVAHSTPGLGTANDPNSANFKENLPAGYLRCDGSILNVKDFIALAEVLGAGSQCRFKKETVTLTEPNPETGELVDITNSDSEYAMEDEEDYSFQHQEMQQLIRALGENHSPLKEHMYHTLPIYHRFDHIAASVRSCHHGHTFLSTF